MPVDTTETVAEHSARLQPSINLHAPVTAFHHHHHHHLFLKRPFLPRSARVRCFSRYEVSPHIPEHYPFRVQTQLLHIIPHTFSPSLPAPTRTSHPSHHHISTGQHPIISTLTLHMPKPPQSTTPHHLSHTLNPQKTTNPHCAFYPSATPHTSISPSSAPFSPDFADLLSSSPRFQSHMSIHSGHNLCSAALVPNVLPRRDEGLGKSWFVLLLGHDWSY